MKKTAFIVALLMCLSQLAACGENNDSINSGMSNDTEVSVALSSPVEQFIDFIKNGEYLKAVESYEKDLYGNYQYESEASDGIAALLKDLNKEILNGQKSESESKKITGAVDSVLSKTNISVTDYDELKMSINGSVASKAAFSAGKELEGLRQYVDAIAEYKKVIESDSDYMEAKNAIDRCVQAAKKDALDAAAAFADEGKYTDAIAELNELNSKLPYGDSELEAKITVYTKAYASDTVAKAEEAFVTPSTDYVEALEIINTALQYLPDNEDLNDKKAYYQSFFPVNIYDIEEVKGSAIRKSNDEDIYGNEYTKCFRNNCDLTYHLDESYNTFEATIYVLSKKNNSLDMTAEIYADGKLIYQNLKISDNSTQPFKIELDVTGVEELRIVLDDGDRIAANHFGITNMIIQRTEK